MTNLGYVVRTAANGRAALAVAKELQPDVALLDIGLPDVDGYELGRLLQEARRGSSWRSRDTTDRLTNLAQQSLGFSRIF